MTTATLDKKAGLIELRMTFETAMNIRGLCRDRLRDNDKLVEEFPDLPMAMEASTRGGYETTIKAIEEVLR